MTKLLSITAAPDAPVACDMTEADDSLADRREEYRRLFADALLAHESTDTATTFRFAARDGVAEHVLDLVRREAVCCPYLSYEVDQVGDEIVWVSTGTGGLPIIVQADAGRSTSIRAPGDDLDTRR